MLSSPPHSKWPFLETTSGPVLFARWQRSTRTETMQRSLRLSAWLPEPHTIDAMFKGPANTSLCFDVWKRCDDNMTGGNERSVNQTEVWTSFDILRLLIWRSLPSQLAGPSPVFLGVTWATRLSTSRHQHEAIFTYTNQSSRLQPDALI